MSRKCEWQFSCGVTAQSSPPLPSDPLCQLEWMPRARVCQERFPHCLEAMLWSISRPLAVRSLSLSPAASEPLRKKVGILTIVFLTAYVCVCVCAHVFKRVCVCASHMCLCGVCGVCGGGDT